MLMNATDTTATTATATNTTTTAGEAKSLRAEESNMWILMGVCKDLILVLCIFLVPCRSSTRRSLYDL